MRRLYYFVSGSAKGWALYPDTRQPLMLFPTREEALREADELMREMHECTGRPTGVRLKREDGSWLDMQWYGHDFAA